MIRDIFYAILGILFFISLITIMFLGFGVIIILVIIDTFINFMKNTNFLDIYRKDKRGK